MLRLAALALLLVASPLRAQEFPLTLPGAGPRGGADGADYRASLSPAKGKPGDTLTLTLTIAPRPRCHTYPFFPPPEQDSRSRWDLPNPKRPDPAYVLVPQVPFADPPGASDKSGGLAYYHEVTWSIPVKVAAAAKPGKQSVTLTGAAPQVCTENSCLFVNARDLPKVELEVLPGDATAAPQTAPPPAVAPTQTAAVPAKSESTQGIPPRSYEEYEAGLKQVQARLTGDTGGVAIQGGLLGLLAAAIFWGYVSLATPCVFPMIPITVSLFLKQANQSTGTLIRLAGVYSLTIVVVLGSAAMLLLTTFQELSINEWMNLFLGALFLFFAASLFGLFEVSLPRVVSFVVACGWVFVAWHAVRAAQGGWADRERAASLAGGAALLAFLSWAQLTGRGAALESRFLQSTERGRKAGGMLGTVAGAMAFSVVSFTCVAPFLGGFAGVLQSGGYTTAELALAGLAFAAAFASPFFVLALFPGLAKKLPKSGGWLDTVKAVMGFLELAAAFKFFRTAELRVTGTTGYFTYEVCLAAWVAISLAAGLYLLHAYRLPHDYEEKGPVGVWQLFAAIAFLGLGVYLAPGLMGHRPTGVPYAWVNSFLLPEPEAQSTELPWSPDLPGTLAKARQATGPAPKLVLIDFTGKTCSNCKYNETHVFTQPAVKELLRKYALVQLYTDNVPPTFYSPAPSAADLRDEGELNQKFQAAVFRTAQLPLYVILEPLPDGASRVRGVYAEGKINDVAGFGTFLEGGLKP